MIRVLHVIDKMSVQGSGLHGIARALAWWSARLDPAEFQMRVLSLRRPEPEAEALFAKAGIDLAFASLGKFSPRTLLVLLREARSFRPDILHLHGYAAHHFGRIAGKLLRIPVIVHEHVVFPRQALYLDLADRLLAPLTTHALAISEPVADFMRTKRHIPADRLETFFYGIPFDELQEPDESDLAAARAEAGVQPGDIVISTVGRLAQQKDLPCLIEAFSRLLPRHPTARLVIIGEGPERSTVERLRQSYNMADRVYLAGFRSDVRPWLAMTDIFVIPSSYEGGPLTLFEAMRLGKAVVATPVGLVPEALHDGINGFLVPIGDVAAMTTRLDTLASDPDLRATMGAAGRRESERWDVNVAVARLADVYLRLAPAAGRAATPPRKVTHD